MAAAAILDLFDPEIASGGASHRQGRA